MNLIIYFSNIISSIGIRIIHNIFSFFELLYHGIHSINNLYLALYKNNNIQKI